MDVGTTAVDKEAVIKARAGATMALQAWTAQLKLSLNVGLHCLLLLESGLTHCL
jgi:hypothetical protein